MNMTKTVTIADSDADAASAPINAKRVRVIGAFLGASLLLAACGGSSDSEGDAVGTASEASTEVEAAGPAGQEGQAIVTTATVDLGDILVNDAGLTIYGFTADSSGVSTCEGGCAAAWPPVVVDSSELPDGLDAGVFSVIERSDGTHQLQAGDWPLYLYASDGAAGDINGQGSGGSWFVVAPDGSLIK